MAIATRARVGDVKAVFAAMDQGEIDVANMPISDAFDARVGGRPASLDDAVARLRAAVTSEGYIVLDPSKVEDTPVLVVTHDTSAKLGLHRISDLATLTSPAVLGAPVDCIGSATCLRGLEDRYGLRFQL
jgi:glycine betaine/choline ABC-type transport system substrate-binding protein